MRLIALISILGFSLYSQEPEKLSRLRQSYEAAVTKATAPLQKTYLQELLKLKDEYTRAAKLDEALAVTEAIKKLQVSEAVAKDAPPKAPISEIAAKKRPTNGDLRKIEACFESKTWEFKPGSFCYFKEDGKGTHFDTKGRSYDTVSWKIEADGALHVNGFYRHRRVVLISDTEAKVEETTSDGKVEEEYTAKLSTQSPPNAK